MLHMVIQNNLYSVLDNLLIHNPMYNFVLSYNLWFNTYSTREIYGPYLNVRCKATFIPNVCGILTILLLDYALHIKLLAFQLHIIVSGRSQKGQLFTFRWWYTSTPIFMASLKEEAPVGRIMNSCTTARWESRIVETCYDKYYSWSASNLTCMASLLPAWEPPLITLKAGTGSTRVLFPARFAICWKQWYFSTLA